MAWQCLVGGANGLVFYSFFDLVAMDARTPFARRWAEVVRVAAEIKAHERFFLSTEAAPAVTGVPDGLEAAAWRFGDETLVAAVNTTHAPLRAEVQVAGGPFAVDLHDGLIRRGEDGGMVALRRPRAAGRCGGGRDDVHESR